MPRRKNPQPSGDSPPQRELRPRSSAQAPNMAGSKSPRPSEDPPPQRQVRPRPSAQAQSLPTPDDRLSVIDSAAPSISLPVKKKVLPGVTDSCLHACPDACLDTCLGIGLGGAALAHTALPFLYLVALLAPPLFFRFVVLVK